jgi:hypothetical protein
VDGILYYALWSQHENTHGTIKINPSINLTNAFDIQRFSPLDVPANYQYANGI